MASAAGVQGPAVLLTRLHILGLASHSSPSTKLTGQTLNHHRLAADPSVTSTFDLVTGGSLKLPQTQMPP